MIYLGRNGPLLKRYLSLIEYGMKRSMRRLQEYEICGKVCASQNFESGLAFGRKGQIIRRNKETLLSCAGQR